MKDKFNATNTQINDASNKEYPDLDYNLRRPKTKTRFVVHRIVFIILFLIEAYYCYTWLVEPLLPVISNIIENRGVPTFEKNMMDVAHPMTGIKIAGLKPTSFISLMTNTMIRLGIFTLLFGVTEKIRRATKNLLY